MDVVLMVTGNFLLASVKVKLMVLFQRMIQYKTYAHHHEMVQRGTPLLVCVDCGVVSCLLHF